MTTNNVTVKSLKTGSWSGFHRFPKCKDSIAVKFGRNGCDLNLTDEEQENLETRLGLQKGQLSPFSPYLREYVVRFLDKPLTLDLSKPQDKLDYLVLLTSERVAKSKDALLTTPKAEYVIVDAGEDAKRENVKVKEEKKAMLKFGKMTISDMKKVLKLMGKRVDNSQDELVENTLFEIVKKDPTEFNRVVGVSDFDLRILIEDLLHANILRKTGSKYTYADDTIGTSFEETVEYLKDPKNQEVLLAVKNKLETKKI